MFAGAETFSGVELTTHKINILLEGANKPLVALSRRGTEKAKEMVTFGCFKFRDLSALLA